MGITPHPVVIGVCRSSTHTFSKDAESSIMLIAGLGIEGDAHMGATVKHRSRVARDPTQPNLRQVHLIHAELHDELKLAGYDVTIGQLGENITTQGIDLLGLSTGTLLRIGKEAVVEVTGLRNPCLQLDKFKSGLMAAVLGKDAAGHLIRKCGVMGVVVHGGVVSKGDAIAVQAPTGTHTALKPV